jgi:diguanylate cyclase (GGDEF)-like protein
VRSKRWLIPEGGLDRTRLGALGVAFIGVLSQLGGLGSDLHSDGYNRLAGVSIMLLLLIILVTYVRRRDLLWSLPITPVLIALGGSGLRDPLAGTALALATTVALSLYGSTVSWVLRLIGAAAAVPAAVALTPESIDRTVPWNSPAVLSLIPQIALMATLSRGIYLTMRRQERDSEREALLARAGRDMLGLTDLEQVREIGRRTAEDLATLTAGTALLVVRRGHDGLYIANLAGLPAHLRGRPIGDDAIGDPARLGELLPGFQAWHIDSLGADPAHADLFMVVAGRRRVPAEVLNAFRNLSHQVVLAENSCRAHAELEHQAHHDHLTHLPTRSKFFRTLQNAVDAAPAGTVALLNVDLDDFKQVNDRYGHAAGDELLIEVAFRMAAVAASGGLAARFGGDEFALLLTGLAGPGEAEHIAGRLCTALAAPVCLTDATVTVGASIGVAVSEPGITIAELTRRADLAMYSAKAGGKNAVRTFPPAELVALP